MSEFIGIKLADGSFYPILSDELREKELELTTVRDNQKTVQIDLFRKKDDVPEYISSLIVQDIAEKSAGDPTISLKLNIDADNNLSAEAADIESGIRQALKVSLEEQTPLEGSSDFDITSSSNVEFGTDPNREYVSVSPDEDDVTENYTEDGRKKGHSKLEAFLVAGIGLIALIIAIFLLLRGCKKENPTGALDKTDKVVSSKKDTTTSNPPKPSENEKNKNLSDKSAEDKNKQAELAKKKAEDEKRKADEKAKAEAADAKAKAEAEKAKAAAEAKKKSGYETTASGAVRYKLKWGDTLWDLSETFYKDPWKFQKIADYNKIKNPSYIIAGTYIDIPPQ